MTICNGPKQIISTSGEFELLSMVLEPGFEGCASEDTGPQWGGLWDLTSWNITYKGVETSP